MPTDSSQNTGVWNANYLFPSTFHTFIESTETIVDRELADLHSSIDVALSSRNTTQFKTIAETLIKKLLDFDSPKVDDKLVDLLLCDGKPSSVMLMHKD